MRVGIAHRPLGLVGVAALVALGAAACGGSSTGGNVTAPTTNATTPSTGPNATACQNLAQTISQIPNRLAQAASSSQPAQNVQSTIQSIDNELMSQASSASSDLKSAVQNYVDQVKQVVSQAANGQSPDLSKLQPTQISSICQQSGVNLNNVTPSVSASVSVSTSP